MNATGAESLNVGVQVLHDVRSFWKAAPVPKAVRRVMAKPLYAASLGVASLSRTPPLLSTIQLGPLVVSGFYRDTLGVGRGAHATARGLESAHLPVVRHDIRAIIHSEPYHLSELPAGPGGVWIQHCNAPENDLLFSHLRSHDVRGRYRIAYWAWELPVIPRAWRRTARAFHEIWTPSRFVAHAVQPYARRVRVMPHPVRLTDQPADRARFRLPKKAIVFAAFADARSALARKNPAGVVEAYRRAFPEPDGSTFLSIKIISPDMDPEGMASLRALVEGRPDIAIWSEDLSSVEILTYIKSIDVVVSLHRSEGFGLVLAEAYLMGKPVLATAWSGNLDFTQAASHVNLVGFQLTPVVDPSGRYRGGRWAEPDLVAASDALRRLAADPSQRMPAPSIARGVAEALHQPWDAAALALHPWIDFVAQDTRRPQKHGPERQ